MFWVILFVLCAIFVLGYLGVSNQYIDTVRNLKMIKGYYEKIEKGMSISEVESLLGGKGVKYSKNKYRWLFDNTIIATEYMQNSETPLKVSLIKYLQNPNKYLIEDGQAFVEVKFENNLVCEKVEVGL